MAPGVTGLPNKELKLTKPSIMELRSLTLCSRDIVSPSEAAWPGYPGGCESRLVREGARKEPCMTDSRP